MTQQDAIARLTKLLDDYAPVAVAVSGGVDSMTLADLAARHLGAAARMIHAVSPAVPQAATHRVKNHATRHGWSLTLIDAGEFADPRYRRNPANRCFFCKTHLYGAMARSTEAQLLSGTNLDDLADWRPGLAAAKDHDVAHPFVEAGIDKATVRAIARALGLDDIAELPAAPCLSSRVETGIAIDPDALFAIDRVETELRLRYAPRTVRCRVRAEGIVIELDTETLSTLAPAERADMVDHVARAFGANPSTTRLAPYERGSAFLTPAAGP